MPRCPRRVRARLRFAFRAAALAAALPFGAPDAADARVFQRLGGRLPERLRDAGGTVAYESDVTINGGRGRLTVTGFTQPAGEVARILRRVAGANASTLAAGGTLNTTVNSGGSVTRLLAFSLPTHGRTLVISIEQSENDYRLSRERPERAALAGLPVFADSTPRLFVRDDKTQMSLAVSDTTADADTVHRDIAAQLARQGWSATMPAAPAGAALRVYGRGAEICCVHVSPLQSAAGNAITLLHKQRGIE